MTMNPARTAVALLALLAGAGTAAPPTVDEAAGPPTDLPGPVPEFVGELHRTIAGFFSGSVDSLGSAVSGPTPGGGSAG